MKTQKQINFADWIINDVYNEVWNKKELKGYTIVFGNQSWGYHILTSHKEKSYLKELWNDCIHKSWRGSKYYGDVYLYHNCKLIRSFQNGNINILNKDTIHTYSITKHYHIHSTIHNHHPATQVLSINGCQVNGLWNENEDLIDFSHNVDHCDYDFQGNLINGSKSKADKSTKERKIIEDCIKKQFPNNLIEIATGWCTKNQSWKRWIIHKNQIKEETN